MAKIRKAEKPAPPEKAEVNRARRIYRKLRKAYPDAKCALHHRSAFELLVATILSAQCTDERVNKTTPALFDKYPTPQKMAKATQADMEKMLRSTGLFRNKAKSLRESSADIVERFDGEVPRTMDELLTLRGVARKTANVVLGNAFDINVGVVVDTHVKRLSTRMGFTEQAATDKIERDLMARFAHKDWTMLAHVLIWHGRQVCQARKPDCENCPVAKDCPKIGVE